MEIDSETVRLAVFEQLAQDGRVDRTDQLAERLGVDAESVARALSALHDRRHLVLDESGAIELAHPFGTRDFGFSVKSTTTLWWGGCAWDAFAITHLVPAAGSTLVATTCPGCGAALAWNVDPASPPEGAEVAHFLVPMHQVWDDVIHACEHQSIFCGDWCVETWLSRTGHTRGAVFSLTKLWMLASDWYTGRLQRGYRRREPVEAARYFAGAGLIGPFWCNEDFDA